MKRTLILTRHLTTSWNREGRVQGHTDIELDDGGREEARLIAQKLKDLGISRIVSSDLSRARETAEIISQALVVPVTTDKRLRECAFGAIEGLTRGEAKEKYGDGALADWDDSECVSYDFSPYGGESRMQVLERQLALLAELPDSASNEKILLVGHGRSLNTLLASLGYLPNLERADWRVIEC